jgi:hypothetical protein
LAVTHVCFFLGLALLGLLSIRLLSLLLDIGVSHLDILVLLGLGLLGLLLLGAGAGSLGLGVGSPGLLKVLQNLLVVLEVVLFRGQNVRLREVLAHLGRDKVSDDGSIKVFQVRVASPGAERRG